MADFLKAKKNPAKGFKRDICIYVKVRPPDDHPKHSYLDFVDATDKVEYVGSHPEVGVIVQTEIAKKYLEERTGRKDIIVIPEHHCNYERTLRPDRPVTTVGIIGGKDTFQLPLPEFEAGLKKMGLNLLYYEGFWKHFKTGRLAVVDFNNKIDIQVVYRKEWYIKSRYFANPLKLENAGSFGIPTVSYPEKDYKAEWNDHFIEATSLWEMLKHVRRLKEDPVYYKEWQARSLEPAEKYHIERISKLYKKLLH